MTVEKEKQVGWKQKIVHEMTEYWINFVYLAVVFFAFTSYRRLILAEYQVSYVHYGIAVIQAAVLAKIILIGEAAGAGRKYEDKPLIVPTLHKTIVFAIWVVGFKVLEHMIGALVRGKGLPGGFHDLISEGWYEILANGLVVISAFVPFFAIKELGQVLGRERLRALFFRRGRPSIFDNRLIRNLNQRRKYMKAKVTITAMLAVLLAAIAAAPDRAQAQASDAMAILKAMSDYVSSQKTIELTFDSDIEVITPQLEKIQFTNSGEALLSRPDKLRAHRVGGYADVELYFDGKSASVFGKHINGYAQFDAPGSVDQLIEALRAGHGVALPGADLLLSNAYDVLMAGVKEFKHIGRGVIDGLECEHLAFRNFDTDWQLWVEVGERPIPRKLVITSKTLNSAPQYTLRVKDWKTGIQPAPDAFTFVPPAGAQELSRDALIELDELPQGAEEGGNQ